jgi:hypothetical protein
VEEGAPEPLTGAIAAVVDTLTACATDIQDCQRTIARDSHLANIASGKMEGTPDKLGKQLHMSRVAETYRTRPYVRLVKNLAVNVTTGVTTTYNRAQ